MISQFFILSARGDIIVNKDYRNDIAKTSPQLFFRNVKLYKGDAPPLFNIDAINFAYMKKNGLYFVTTTRFNVTPAFILQILNKMVKIIRDFLGVLNQEYVRKNFVLIYEIADQMLDFGYPQLLSTEMIKPLIVNETIIPSNQQQRITRFGTFKIFSPQTINSKASQQSVISKNQQNSIFCDIFEKIHILFNSSGYVIDSRIDGCVQLTSFLVGNPPLKLAFNDDLALKSLGQIGSIIIDDCNFHQCVNFSQFQVNKILKIIPPEGQCVVMNYRVTSDFIAPFKVISSIEEVGNYKIELTVMVKIQQKIKANFPPEVIATIILVKFNVPSNTSNVYCQLIKNSGNQKAEYKENSKQVQWKIQKMQGGSEYTMISKIALQGANTYIARKQLGPIKLVFEIPMFNVSNLQIKYLRILKNDDNDRNQHKWVRYITNSSSYVCRL